MFSLTRRDSRARGPAVLANNFVGAELGPHALLKGPTQTAGGFTSLQTSVITSSRSDSGP